MLHYVHFRIDLLTLSYRAKLHHALKSFRFVLRQENKEKKKRKRLGLGKKGLCRIQINCY